MNVKFDKHIKIREYRLAKGLTQKELAYAIGTTTQMISKYERAEIVPSIYRLLDIAKVLDTDVYSLLC